MKSRLYKTLRSLNNIVTKWEIRKHYLHFFFLVTVLFIKYSKQNLHMYY